LACPKSSSYSLFENAKPIDYGTVALIWMKPRSPVVGA